MRPSIALFLGAALLLTCARAPVDPVAAQPEPAGSADPLRFSPENAWEHLRQLTEIGPRAAGTRGAARARDYIRAQLEALGLEVASFHSRVSFDAGGELELETLIAVIPGESSDLFVLAAPYDTRHFDGFEFVGVNSGGSGPAVLLELARVLSQRPLAYTTWLVFLDGESPLGRGSSEEATTAWIGSTELALAWRQEGHMDAIRVLFYLTQVSDADLRIARDLRSHRGYREILWSVGQRRGYENVFQPGQRYDSPVAGHVPFLSRGLRRAVLVMDESFGGEEPPGIYAYTEDDTLEHSSPQSLGAVGEVVHETLEEISARLAKIDSFAGAPLREPVGPTSLSPRSRSPAPPEDAAPSSGTPATEPPSGTAP